MSVGNRYFFYAIGNSVRNKVIPCCLILALKFLKEG